MDFTLPRLPPHRRRQPEAGGRMATTGTIRTATIRTGTIRTATIKDVARAAGVSPATVCRALTSPELVRAATRERVVQAARDLGYSPNRAARGLITGRTANLGLIVPDLANPFFPSVVKAIQARARESDYTVFLADTDEDPTVEAELVRALSKQVDGMVLCSPRMSEDELRGVAGDTPMVMLNRRVGRIPSVTV